MWKGDSYLSTSSFGKRVKLNGREPKATQTNTPRYSSAQPPRFSVAQELWHAGSAGTCAKCTASPLFIAVAWRFSPPFRSNVLGASSFVWPRTRCAARPCLHLGSCMHGARGGGAGAHACMHGWESLFQTACLLFCSWSRSAQGALLLRLVDVSLVPPRRQGQQEHTSMFRIDRIMCIACACYALEVQAHPERAARARRASVLIQF